MALNSLFCSDVPLSNYSLTSKSLYYKLQHDLSLNTSAKRTMENYASEYLCLLELIDVVYAYRPMTCVTK